MDFRPMWPMVNSACGPGDTRGGGGRGGAGTRLNQAGDTEGGGGSAGGGRQS
jgi:hypothetical protein